MDPDRGIVSVDDHLVEPPDLWTSRLPKAMLDVAPHVEETPSGSEQWVFGDFTKDTLGGLSTAGMDISNSVLQGRYDTMRRGSWDPVARLADMDEDGTLASMCFPSVFGFSGTYLSAHPDKAVALECVKAYNDFVLDEWCAAAPDRYIPLVMVPLWDVGLAVKEVERTAARGARSVAFTENPHRQGYASIHGGAWDPFFAAVQEAEMPLSMHIGSSSYIPPLPDDGPPMVQWSSNFLNACYSMIDWLLSDNFERFPGLKAVWSESQIGWIPYVIEHCDRQWHTHAGWTSHKLTRPPSSYVADHVFGCFIDDEFGARNLDAIGVDNVMIETDYPHPDGTWPNSKKIVDEQLRTLPDEVRWKITQGNAQRVYRFPLPE